MSINLELKSIPESAGVYIFRKSRTPIYIGKAVNLRKRLNSYFRKNASSKIRQLLQEATSLDWIETSSEIEAFLKEAELIKKYRPKYNVVLRDDKNYFYVGITREEFPRIFVTHQPHQVKSSKLKVKSFRYVGPFTNGTALKATLKIVRRVFPYCICKKTHQRKCLNAQIGKCLSYCCLLEEQNKWSKEQILEYNRNIKNIVAVLSGRQKKIVRQLKKEMRGAARDQNFEKAAEFRDQLSGLKNIFSHRPFLVNHGGLASIVPWVKIEREIRVLAGIKRVVSRIEGYDISNIFGKEATGSMVVFTEGKPTKEEYRKFRIKTVRGISDIDMLKEVVSRRLNHPEWSWPEFMLIDGGRAQLNAVLSVLKTKKFLSAFAEDHGRKPVEASSKIAVAALAKKEEELYLPRRKFPLALKNLPPALAQFLQRVRDESHRFARKYHHKLREIYYGTVA